MSKISVVPDLENVDIPTCFKTHFTDDDEFFMLAFNIHAGAAIERSLMYEALQAKVNHLEAENQRLRSE